jgi:hypothetical protein
VAADETSASVQVQALRPARPTRIRAHTGPAIAEVLIGVGGLELAEVLYDPTNNDDQKQWVKLVNTSSVIIDLSRYSLGAGKASYLETTARLQGMVAPYSCFVVGGPYSSADNGWPTYSQLYHFVPLIPHGGSNAAGVALFDTATATTATLPMDAVIYGTANTGNLVGSDGTVATPDSPGAHAGYSLLRTPTGWQEHLPTPNTCSASP